MGYSKMDIRITLLFLFLFCFVPRSTVGKNRIVNTDLFYFPDQADYIKRAEKCPDNMILWLGNGQCYKEGERGPCNVGRVLVIDKRLLKPYCKDILQWFFYLLRKMAALMETYCSIACRKIVITEPTQRWQHCSCEKRFPAGNFE